MKLKFKSQTSFNVKMKLSTNLCFDVSRLMPVTIIDQLPDVASDADGRKCCVIICLH